MIVVDASILAYMLLPGEHTAEVVRLRERDPRWVAPLFWRSELLNVLWKVVRQGGLTREEALLLMGEADGLLESEGYRVPDGLVLSLAIDSGCTAYDCHYVALAQGLGVPLLTHDKQVLSAFPEVAIRPADYLRHRPRGTEAPSSRHPRVSAARWRTFPPTKSPQMPDFGHLGAILRGAGRRSDKLSRRTKSSSPNVVSNAACRRYTLQHYSIATRRLGWFHIRNHTI